MQNPKELREMAAWYRKFAERAGNPMIWECRLHTAEDLEAEAQRIEKTGVAAEATPLASGASAVRRPKTWMPTDQVHGLKAHGSSPAKGTLIPSERTLL